jgi:hypothetical protein
MAQKKFMNEKITVHRETKTIPLNGSRAVPDQEQDGLREHAVDALLALKVPKKQAISYVAGATGDTVETITASALANWTADKRREPRPERTSSYGDHIEASGPPGNGDIITHGE